MYRAPVHVQGPCCVRRRACSPAAAANKNTCTPCVLLCTTVVFVRGMHVFLCCPWCGCFVCPQHLWQCASWSIVNITYSKACLILSRLSLFISRSAGVWLGGSPVPRSGCPQPILAQAGAGPQCRGPGVPSGWQLQPRSRCPLRSRVPSATGPLRHGGCYG